MKTFKIVILTIICSLAFGIIGGYVFTGVYELYKEGTPNQTIESKVTLVDYPKVESSNYEVVIEKAFDTIVEIRTTVITQSFFGQSEGEMRGSGVIISDDGYIVTNYHVIENASNLKIISSTGDEYDATIIGSDQRSDIAIIKINAKGLKYASLADSDKLKLGQEVIAIGNPLGEGLTCCNGIVSALAKEIVIDNNPMTLIQTNAAVNAGNSGGGLFNMNGDLIGVVNAKSSASYYEETSVEGMGYAIPSKTVAKIMNDLMKYGYVKQRATLGVTVYNVAYTYGDKKGLLVESVIENSAADDAGIRNGDLIIEIDDKSTESYTDMSKILLNHEVGDKITVTVIRDGKELDITVKLKEATNN